MNKVFFQAGRLAMALLLGLLGFPMAQANAVIPGITGPNFTLTAGTAHIDTPDGDSVLIWAYSDGTNPVQYPGPTLIVNQGDTVTITLTNHLSVPTSMVFPGQGEVVASGGSPGLLTQEAAVGGGSVSYSFVASQPGTYMYHSGTRPELQIEMGLLGALIVRPSGFDQDSNRTAYGHPDTAYDHEYLFLLSEMDPYIHDLVDFGFIGFVDNTIADPVFWFINGRNGVDTLAEDFAPFKPNQPYGALARTRPGEKVLLRLIGGGRDQHAFHPHGNHSFIIARDGRMVTSDPSDPSLGPDLSTGRFTITPAPGATVDALFDWTSKGLGWDIYGTGPGFQHLCDGKNLNQGATPGVIDSFSGEDCTYHGEPIPVNLPGLQDLTFGGWYSGSPFLGHFGQLPPGEGGLNLNAGLFFMWHSHNEKELTNFDIFPGGMMTFVVIEPPDTPIP